jgi:hypothetical protein
MRRLLLAAVVAVGLAGCIPAAIRTEIDFLDTVLATAVTETALIEDAEQRADKAVRALKRAAPHAANLKRWAEGEKPND